jgi:hypothetical protein
MPIYGMLLSSNTFDSYYGGPGSKYRPEDRQFCVFFYSLPYSLLAYSGLPQIRPWPFSFTLFPVLLFTDCLITLCVVSVPDGMVNT